MRNSFNSHERYIAFMALGFGHKQSSALVFTRMIETERDQLRELCAELLSALKDCKTDLFFKHENQHGAEKAYNHPSVEKARNAITKAESTLGDKNGTAN